ncbi:MAG: hypothetical protein ABIO65_13310, partial [Nitrospiria bacterium]
VLTAAAACNPFISPSEILERHIVAQDIGLVIGGRDGRPTLLYVWSAVIADLGPWMAHYASWIGVSPQWRRLHRLEPSEGPSPRVILAAPDMAGSARAGHVLLAAPPEVVRYVSVMCGRSATLCWDDRETGLRSPTPSLQPDDQPRPSSASLEVLSGEELAFFRRR